MRTLSLLPLAFAAVSALGVRCATLMKDFHLGLEARSYDYYDDSRFNRGNRPLPANPAGDRPNPDQYRRIVNSQSPSYGNLQLQADRQGPAEEDGESRYFTTPEGDTIYFSIEEPEIFRSQQQYLTGVSGGHQGDREYSERSYVRARPDPNETPRQRARREAIERSEETPPHLSSSMGRHLQSWQSDSMTPQANVQYRSLLQAGNRDGSEPRSRSIETDSDEETVTNDETDSGGAIRHDVPMGTPGRWSPRPNMPPGYRQGRPRRDARSPSDEDLESRFARVQRSIHFRTKKRDEPHPRHQKRDVMSSIATQEDEATFGITNSSVDQSAEFQLYLAAYRTAQANVSDLLFPIFDVVLNGTSSSLIYDLVWSVYSDLTGIGPVIVGPYSYGMHCFDWIEDLYFNSTNTTRSGNLTDPTTTSMLATHQILINIYNFVWTEATTVANANGLLDDMYKVSQYLMPTNKSIATKDWLSPERDFDNSYFTIYNETSV